MVYRLYAHHGLWRSIFNGASQGAQASLSFYSEQALSSTAVGVAAPALPVFAVEA
jgi:hypothetical protein